MKILDRVKIVGEYYNGKEGVLTGINNNIASVVMRYEVDNKPCKNKLQLLNVGTFKTLFENTKTILVVPCLLIYITTILL